jgi:hypothetical protein
MNSLIFSSVCILGKNLIFFLKIILKEINLALISITNGLNCVSCVGWSNTGCNDPYDEATSGDLPVPGNTYCLVSDDFYASFFSLNTFLIH